jgi:hypothetical protein
MDKLEQFKKMFALIQSNITKEEFVEAFRKVAQVILTFRNEIMGEITGIRTDWQLAKAELKDSNARDLEKKKAELEASSSDIRGRLPVVESGLKFLKESRPNERASIIAEVKTMIPEPVVLPSAIEVRDELEMLEGDNRLSFKAIWGLDTLVENLRNEFRGMMKKTGAGAAGGGRGVFVYINGVKKGITSSLNIAPGLGVSLSWSKVNGLDTLTINASGGGVTVETPPEVPDAVIVEFTVSDEPQWIVADGTTYYAGAGYSYSSGTGKVTMDVPPSSFIRAII